MVFDCAGLGALILLRKSIDFDGPGLLISWGSPLILMALAWTSLVFLWDSLVVDGAGLKIMIFTGKSIGFDSPWVKHVDFPLEIHWFWLPWFEDHWFSFGFCGFWWCWLEHIDFPKEVHWFWLPWPETHWVPLRNPMNLMVLTWNSLIFLWRSMVVDSAGLNIFDFPLEIHWFWWPLLGKHPFSSGNPLILKPPASRSVGFPTQLQCFWWPWQLQTERET